MVQSFYTPARLPPTSPNNWAETSDRTFGNTFRFGVDGLVTEVGVYGPTSSPPTPWRVKVFNGGTQVLLAAKTAGFTMATAAWNWVVLDTPLSVTPGVDYTFCYYMNGAGNYVLTENGVTSDQVNGDITAIQDGGRHIQSPSQDAFPASLFNALWFVDMKFTPAGAPPSVVTLGLITESGTVSPISRRKTKALGQIVAPAAVAPVTRSKSKRLGQITEAATVFPVTASSTDLKIQVLGQIVGAGIVLPLGGVVAVHTVVDLSPRYTEVTVAA